MEIAQAQYAPDQKPLARYRMQTDEDTEDSEADEEGDDDQLKIYREIIDEQFTVENIGQVSMQVRSRFRPLDLLGVEFPVYTENIGKTQLSCKGCLLKHVICNNDRKGLQYYYDLTVHFSGHHEDERDGGNPFVAFPPWAFWLAVEQGRLELLADMIKWAGAGLPLETLVKKTGLEVKEVPKYYQGLTVYGKKRKDWATAGRGVIQRGNDSVESPLLHAARCGSMESVQWFLSDAPLRIYLEFGKSKAAKDARLKHLNQFPGGFDKAVTSWLGAQSDLVIFSAVLGPNDLRTERLIEYLIRVYPSSLEARRSNGMTPLFLACWLGRANLIKLLINKGADQSVKDKTYDNILHAALESNPSPSHLAAFLEMLDPELLTHLFKERSGIQTSDGRTPLHRWLNQHSNMINKDQGRSVEALRVLLKYSEGRELDILDAGGDTPLHTLIRQSASSGLIRELLEFNPELLYRENASGATPAELIHDMFVSSCVAKPHRRSYQRHVDGSLAKALLDKDPGLFVGGGAAGNEVSPWPLSGVERIHHLVAGFAAAHPGGTRRLVSLHEANDVALRIGESYQGQRYGWAAVPENGARSRRRILMRRARGRTLDGLVDEEEEEDEDEALLDKFIFSEMRRLRGFAWTNS